LYAKNRPTQKRPDECAKAESGAGKGQKRVLTRAKRGDKIRSLPKKRGVAERARFFRKKKFEKLSKSS
jgi:hypothetical protein